MKTALPLLLLCGGILIGTAPAEEPADRVDPFIGTEQSPASAIKGYWASGCCFPGAATPFGLVQFSPDTVKKMPGGYDYSDNRIKAFSLTHFSGRGFLYMQDIGIVPVIGSPAAAPPAAPEPSYATFSHAAESAAPGYYRVRLDSGVTAELTATPRTGMARFTFPAGTDANSLLINPGSNASGALDGEIHLSGDRELEGWTQARIGAGKELYKVYFHARFDRPFASSGTWQDQALNAGAPSAAGPRCGAYAVFAGTGGGAVQVKIGLSFTSAANAADNLQAENGGEAWDFDAVRQAARAAWNGKLSAIRAEGGGGTDETAFYTALYHCLIHPNILDDANGDYLGMDGAVHKVKPGHHHYTHFDGWGLYKTRAPLQALLYPAEASDMAQSLVDSAQQDPGGGVPRWMQINHNSNGMVGDGNVAVLSAMDAFGARDFDADSAAQAMRRNAEDPKTTSNGHAVRPHLADYLASGFVFRESEEHAAAETVEYAATDMAVGYFLRAHGDAKGAEAYFQRAGNWKNLLDPASGYLFPKKKDGTWATTDPASADAWAEGTSSQYTWAVPPAATGELLQAIGAGEAEKRLDAFFTKLDAGPGSAYAYMGDEPCEGAPWIYDFLGLPAKAEKTVRRIELELFTATPGGLPGQDDGGGLSSWYVFSAMGLYPAAPGSGVFLIGSPLFPDIRIRTESGQNWHIAASGAGPAAPYVSSMKIDGKENRALWIPLSLLGGSGPHEIEFNLTPDPGSAWTPRPEDIPSRASF